MSETQPHPVTRPPAAFTAPVRVNLMPAPVRQARAARRFRRAAAFAVVGALAVVGLGSGALLAVQHAVDGELAAHQETQLALLAEQRGYADIAAVLDEIARIDAHLGAAFVDDVSSAGLVEDVRGALVDGMTITGIDVAVPGADAAGSSQPGGASASLDSSGETAIGEVEITGTGRSAAEIEAYSSALADVEGLRVPYLVSTRALDDDRGLAFTLRLTLTDTARSSRFASEETS